MKMESFPTGETSREEPQQPEKHFGIKRIMESTEKKLTIVVALGVIVTMLFGVFTWGSSRWIDQKDEADIQMLQAINGHESRITRLEADSQTILKQLDKIEVKVDRGNDLIFNAMRQKKE